MAEYKHTLNLPQTEFPIRANLAKVEHHGSLYVDSHVGEGTTFTICLPRA
ncbi:MAG: hypothetical protein WC529_03870 [Candidatus Margulisiibacteriota bacterium]